MKYITCLTRCSMADKFLYRLKRKNCIHAIATHFHYELIQQEHRVPKWASLHLHLRLEGTIGHIYNHIFPRSIKNPNKLVMLVYDIIYGLTCAFSMRSILEFWRTRK